MEKKTWSKPMAVAEQFMPNEYISACFYIRCDYAGQTIYANGHSQSHTKNGNGSGCGWENNMVFTVLSGDIQSDAGATIRITELNTRDWLGRPTGDKVCYFVPSEHAQEPRSTTISGVNVGDTIYWVTDVSYWMSHKGTVTYQDANRPQHS